MGHPRYYTSRNSFPRWRAAYGGRDARKSFATVTAGGHYVDALFINTRHRDEWFGAGGPTEFRVLASSRPPARDQIPLPLTLYRISLLSLSISLSADPNYTLPSLPSKIYLSLFSSCESSVRVIFFFFLFFLYFKGKKYISISGRVNCIGAESLPGLD